MGKKIECDGCHLPLGELAGGSKIRKNISFFCESCASERTAIYKAVNDPKLNEAFSQIFKGEDDL